jgi:hypothetical protein
MSQPPAENECVSPSSKRSRTNAELNAAKGSDSLGNVLESPPHVQNATDRPSKRERLDISEEDDVSRLNKIHRSEHSSVDKVHGSQSFGNPTLSSLAMRVSEVQGSDDTKGKDIAAFLGGTGVGKTTTIDFCCGVKIVRVTGDDEYGDSVLDVDPAESKRYLKIGHSSSMTKNIDFLSSPRKNKSSALLLCGKIFVLDVFALNFSDPTHCCDIHRYARLRR